MKTFKEILNGAIKLHKRETGEVITNPSIAAILWTSDDTVTRADSMSKALRVGINKHELILKLAELFPETLLEAFINYDASKKYLKQLNAYSLDYINNTTELKQLHSDLIEGMLPEKQLFFWLNY